MGKKKKHKIKAQKKEKLAVDNLYNYVTGAGTLDDRTNSYTPGRIIYPDTTLTAFFEAMGLLRKAITKPAYDMTREWFNIKTDNERVSELLQEEFSKHGMQEKLKMFFVYKSLWKTGSMLYIGEDNIVNEKLLATPFNEGATIGYINLIMHEDAFTIDVKNNWDVTKKDYAIPTMIINGNTTHRSRYIWQCDNFNIKTAFGVPKIESLLAPLFAQESGIDSIDRILQQLTYIILDDPTLYDASKKKKNEFLCAYDSLARTLGMMIVSPDTKAQQLNTSFQGLKDIFDFLVDIICANSGIPKSILMGRAQGVLKSGDFELKSYYSDIGNQQELDMTPIVNRLIQLFINQRDSELYHITKGSLEYEIEYNALFTLDDKDQAEIDKMNAETEKIKVETEILAQQNNIEKKDLTNTDM